MTQLSSLLCLVNFILGFYFCLPKIENKSLGLFTYLAV